MVAAELEAWLAADCVELAEEAALVATLEVAWLAAEEVAAELVAWLATDCEEALVALALVAVEEVAWLVADCGAALVAAEVVVVVVVPLTSSLSPIKIKLTLANLFAFSMAETEVL